MILSTKSAGSSLCQRLLAQHPDIHTVAWTRHYENETLFWVKAAAILGLPQEDMLQNKMPIPSATARQELVEFLQRNLEEFQDRGEDKEWIFEGWLRLCQRYGPVFLEKSPHHLCQPSALQLLLRFILEHGDVSHVFLGLIRNPLDVCYSAYKRWGIAPEKYQYEWLRSYENLAWLQERLPDRVEILRYEEVVRQPALLNRVLGAAGLPAHAFDANRVHTGSVSRWSQDSRFGFVLAEPVRDLALKLGYSPAELSNNTFPLWPVRSGLHCLVARTATSIRHWKDRIRSLT